MDKEFKPIIRENLQNVKQICQEYQICKLWVFGSVMTDKFNDESDIDLLVSFKEMSFEDYADNYFLVCDIFEQLFNRKIDSLTVNSLSNPYFIRSIEKTKTLLYE